MEGTDGAAQSEKEITTSARGEKSHVADPLESGIAATSDGGERKVNVAIQGHSMHIQVQFNKNPARVEPNRT